MMHHQAKLLMISALTLSLLGSAVSASAQEAEPAQPTKAAQTDKAATPAKDSELVDVIDHAPFDALLKRYVDAKGQVNYKAWKASKDDSERLTQYLAQLEQAKPAEFKRRAQLALYINAYNAFVISSVLAKYPIESVMKVDGFFKTTTHKLAGKKMTLDQLENELIRPQFKEARVHFVLVCAAKSCPRLRAEALTSQNVYKRLSASASEFVNQASRVEGDKLKTSQIFNWFKGDFEAKSGSVEKFLATYLRDKEVKAKLEAGALKLDFVEYDWALNQP